MVIILNENKISNSLEASDLYNLLGDLYRLSKNKTTALNFYFKAYSIRKNKSCDKCKSMLAITLNNIGVIYHENNDIKSLIYFKKSLHIIKNNKNIDENITINVLMNIGSEYSRNMDNENAKKNLSRVNRYIS